MSFEVKWIIPAAYFVFTAVFLFFLLRFIDRKLKAYHERKVAEAEKAFIKLQSKLIDELHAHAIYLENMLTSHDIKGFNRLSFRPDTMRLLKKFVKYKD